MRRVGLIVLTTVLCFTIGFVQAQCNYTLLLEDTYGDGWNGNTIEVTYGSQKDTLTLLDPPGDVDSITLTVNTGDTINLAWLGGGSFAYEAFFNLLDSEGNNIYASGTSPSTGFHFGVAAFCPSCFAPSDFAVSSTATTSANLTWTDVNGSSSWEVMYDTVGFPIGTGTSVLAGSNAYVLNGLLAASSYDVYVRAICGVGDSSNWVGPLSLSTACNTFVLPYSEGFNSTSTDESCWTILNNNNDGDAWGINETYDPSEGDESAVMYTDFNGGSNDDFLISPQIKLTGNDRLRYSIRVRSSGEPNDYEVLLSTSTNDPAAFGNVLLKDTASNTSYEEITLDLSAYSGDVYVAFRIPPGGLDGYYIYIDDVNFEEIPSCFVPDSLEALNLAETTADLSWFDLVASNWEVAYDTAGFVLGSGNRMTTTSNSSSLSGLTANTSYEFYVRAICGVGDSSAWVGPISFSTACGTFLLPYSEGFNSASINEGCWTILNNNNDGDAWNLDDTYDPFEGDESTSLYTDFNGGSNDDYLISPQIKLTGNDRLRYSIRVRSSGEPNDYEVLLSTTTNDSAAFSTVLLKDTASNTTYEEIILDLSAYSGDIYVAFRIPPGGLDGWLIYIDDVHFEEIPTCEAPDSVEISNVTSNSATLNWFDLSASNWAVEYDTAGFTLGSGTLTATTSSSFPVSGLMASTNYEIYIKSICGIGDSSIWVGPISFTTGCNTFIVPYSEGFNTTSTDEACWTIVNNNNDGDAWLLNSTYDPFEGDESAVIYTDFNGGSNDDFLISPQIKLTGNDRLRYALRVRSASEPHDYEVLLSTSTKDPAAFGNVLFVDTASNTSYEEITIDLSAYSGDVYVAFRIPPGGLDGYFLYLDDVNFEEIPSCLPPTSVAGTNLTDTSAALAWVDLAASNWELEYDTAGFTPGSGNIVTTSANPYSISGLTSNTDYEFYVRSICGAGDSSTWVGPIAFSTTCPPFATPFVEGFNSSSTTEECWTVVDNNLDGDVWNTNYSSNPFEGDQVAMIYTDFNGGANDDYLITPPITLNGNEWIRYAYRAASSSEVNDYEVLISTTNSDVSSFSTVLFSDTIGNTSYMTNTIDLSAYSGNVYLAFHIPSGGFDGWRVYIDDVNVEEMPSCLPVTTVASNNVTDSSATLSWTDLNSATSWQIEYGVTGFTPGSGTTLVVSANPYTLNGLMDSESYDVYVQAICGVGDSSTWAASISFTTACPSYSVPWEEGFETISGGGNWPDCVLETGDFTTSTTSTTYNRAPRTGSNFMYTAWGADDWFFSPGINLVAGVTYDFTAWYVTDENTGWDSISIWAGTGQSSADMSTKVVVVSGVLDSIYTELTGQFTPSASGAYNLGIHVEANSNPWYLSFDDISVRETVTCLPVSGITEDGISSTSINVAWTGGGTATDWDIEYGVTGFTVGSGTTVTTSTNPTLITGLNSNQAYDFYVTSDCGPSSSAFGPVSISTGILSVDNLLNNQFHVYPNPAKDILNIEFDQIQNDRSVQLISVTGKIVREMKTSSLNNKLDVRGLSKGIYMLKLVNTTNVEYTRIVLE